MKEAIRESMTSPNPTARAFWSELSSDGKEPPVEDFLTNIVGKLRKGK